MERRGTRVALTLWAGVVIAFLWIPIVIICLYAFNSSNVQSWPIAGFSTKWFSPAIHDPNMTVAFENQYVRVLSVRIPPGGKEPWHTHTWPAVVVYFHLPPSQRLLPDGKTIPRAELKELQISYDAKSQPLHSVENFGKVFYQAYRVELKPTTNVPVTGTR